MPGISLIRHALIFATVSGTRIGSGLERPLHARAARHGRKTWFARRVTAIYQACANAEDVSPSCRQPHRCDGRALKAKMPLGTSGARQSCHDRQPAVLMAPGHSRLRRFSACRLLPLIGISMLRRFTPQRAAGLTLTRRCLHYIHC